MLVQSPGGAGQLANAAALPFARATDECGDGTTSMVVLAQGRISISYRIRRSS